MAYGCQIWGQKGNANRNKISILQNKALKRIHFKPNDEPTNQLFYQSNVVKFNDYVNLQNALFAYDHCNNTLPSSLQNSLIFVRNIHDHNTRNSANKKLALPLTNTERYGINSRSLQPKATVNVV